MGIRKEKERFRELQVWAHCCSGFGPVCGVCGKQKWEVNSRLSLRINWDYVILELEIMCPDCFPKAKVPRTCLEAGLKVPGTSMEAGFRDIRNRDTDIFPETLTAAFLIHQRPWGGVPGIQHKIWKCLSFHLDNIFF